jgi:hypothetical protein
LEKHWKKVFGCLLLPKDWGQTTDLVTEGGTDMLRRIGDQVFDSGHDLGEKYLAIDELAEACEC